MIFCRTDGSIIGFVLVYFSWRIMVEFMLRFPKREVFLLGIQKCETCKRQFTWKEIQKTIRWNYKPLVCRKCGAKHQITIQSKVLFSLSIAVLLFIFSLANLPFNLRIAVIIIVFLSVLLSFPYFAKYKKNEKSVNIGKKG
jgi:CXXC-20-CXXC protein